MTRRLARLTALAALVPALLAVNVGSTSPAVADTSNRVFECTDGGPRPCVVSVLRNGEPLAELGEEWSFYAVVDTWTEGVDTPMTTVRFDVWRGDERRTTADIGFDSLGDTWQVTLDMGTIVPRAVTGIAQDVTVERRKSDGTYTVQVTGHPATTSGQCNPYTYCPEFAENPDPDENQDWGGRFGIDIADFESWSDTQARDAAYGVDVFTNVAVTSVPPGIRHDDATGVDYLYVEMRNRHYLEDGTTVFKGFAEVRIPNEYLRVWYGIPNPELMTSESLDPEVTGRAAGSGTISVTQEPGGDAMLVRIAGVTFSHRVFKILPGIIVPTRPGDVQAERLSSGRAKVEFSRSQVRGAKVTGYQVQCRPTAGSKPVVSAHGRSPVTVTGLASGTAYTCSVRARSKAGPGAWSKGVAVPR